MPSLKQGNESKPNAANLVPIHYVPPNSFAHLVSDGENWQSLGARYGWPATEIVKLNFKTTVAAEINWYLREYVNCDTPTADGYNWRFSSSARNGPSPRAGKIFIVPNWTAILAAAKEATRDAVTDWFRLARLSNATVRGPELTIHQGSIISAPTFRFAFIDRMKRGGAPDRMAEEWADFVEMLLKEFTNSIRIVHPTAFPIYAHWVGMTAPPPMHATRFPPLTAPASDHLVSRGFVRPVLQGYIKSVQADQAFTAIANAYAVWFADSFRLFRASAMADNILATVFPSAGGEPRGMANAPPGFLTCAPMRL